MYVMGLNATYRPEGTTTRLVRQTLAGAASLGASVEMVLLAEHDIRFCLNCLTCYKDLESEIAPCAVQDDVRGILEKIREADGVVFASPVHSGFVTGLMVTFLERATFTLTRPTGRLLGVKSVPEPRLTGKVRGAAIVLSAGIVPTWARAYCDMGTPFLREWIPGALNGEVIGDLYAAAELPRELRDEEGPRAADFRELAQTQLDEAFALGVRLVEAIRSGGIRPYDLRAVEEAMSASQR